jgi:1-phosphofructokinase family hexose kinase
VTIVLATITLNPALDLFLSVGRLIPGGTNRVTGERCLPGGKGINVAKILRELGEPVRAGGFLGGPAAPEFRAFLAKRGIADGFSGCAGAVRTNFQVCDASGGRTELLESGPEISPREWAGFLQQVPVLLRGCPLCAVCGSAPPGITVEMYRALLQCIRRTGTMLLVDASGELLRAAVEESPHLVKPNREELIALLGRDVASEEELFAAAQELVRKGVENVALSLGGEGAALIRADGIWRVRVPEIPVKNTLGCGDTMVAALMLALKDDLPPKEMLRHAAALSAANAETEETAHIEPEEYRRLLPLCRVEQVEG